MLWNTPLTAQSTMKTQVVLLIPRMALTIAAPSKPSGTIFLILQWSAIKPFAHLPMAMATSMPAPIMPSSVGVKPSWSIGFFATPSVMRMT